MKGQIILLQALWIATSILHAGPASATATTLPIGGWTPRGSETVQVYRIDSLTGKNEKLLETVPSSRTGAFRLRIPVGIPVRLVSPVPSSCRNKNGSLAYSALLLPGTFGNEARRSISINFQSTARDRMSVFIHSRYPGQKGSWHRAFKKANWQIDLIFGSMHPGRRHPARTGRAEQAVLGTIAGWRGGNSWEWGAALASDLADSTLDGKTGTKAVAFCGRAIPSITGTVLWRSAVLTVLSARHRGFSSQGAFRLDHSSRMVGLLAPRPDGRWVDLPPMPTPRDSLLIVNGMDNHPVVIGGEAPQGVSNAVEAWNPGRHRWDRLPSYPLSVSYAAGTAFPDGRIFVTGGFNSDGFTGASYLYIPKSRRWIGVASDPVPRAGAAAVFLPDGDILVTGGETGNGITNLTERFIPGVNRWVRDPGAPEGRLGGVSALMPDGRVLVLGGLLKTGGITGEGRYYNPKKHEWEEKAPPDPTARLYGTGALMPDGTLFVLDGFNRTGVLQSMDSYDPRIKRWKTGLPPDLIRRKETGAAVLDDGSLLVVGGEDPVGTSVGNATLFH